MRDAIIEMEHVTRTYGAIQAVYDLSFQVERGEFFGILGPNGAGKTTTIGMLAGLIKPTSGSLRVDGFDPTSEGPKVKARIGLVPQDFAFYPTLSARENLIFWGRIYGLRGQHLRDRIRKTLETVHLSDRADEPVSVFSNGMKRRLNIAVGLVHEPSVLILDEPTVGVDAQSRNAILESLEALARAGITIVYTTHYMDEARRLCHRVAIIDQGRLIALDRPSELIARVSNAFLLIEFGEPVSGALIDGLGGVGGVRVADLEQTTIELATDAPEDAIRSVIEVAKKADVEIRSVNILEPSLETVFLSLTGKHVRDGFK